MLRYAPLDLPNCCVRNGGLCITYFPVMCRLGRSVIVLINMTIGLIKMPCFYGLSTNLYLAVKKAMIRSSVKDQQRGELLILLRSVLLSYLSDSLLVMGIQFLLT